ncbi:type II toxin-antitoxin system HipA family toxin YjjJ [Dokdonella sp.]|uniref:type II toxin-antitoxin system HipA family toxin YjjJ n=1 Tax=Dokdonella sp. TaxID=2291710 RepID=UPI0026154275|nr:type II toxin-antitoxin system HipA family toxin YjjJ [Dokdonella sp.]
MDEARWVALEALLRRQGALPAAAIAAELDLSQPTVSRLLAQAGERLVCIGRARAARYALAHDIARMGSHWPLYRIDADARPERIGELHALHGDGFFFESGGEPPALTHGDVASGLYPGVPWFLDNQRPQGFLGRAFARRVAADIGAPNDIGTWRGDDVVLALLRHGDDQPGDLVLGEASLQRALHAILDPRDTVPAEECVTRYPQLAEATLRGDVVGSPAGGEQPKFAITLRSDEGLLPVIVKFSGRLDTPAGRRWADLLIAEHHACTVLREHDLPAAESAIVEAGSRVFLQSTRFDRTLSLGRRGLVSLAALDAAYYGHGRIDWRAFAAQLQRDGWLDANDARRLRLFGWYGTLIANSDMHLGNASLHLVDRRPLPLARAYDMLPMRFRPLVSGEVVDHRYEIVLPTPEQVPEWREAAAMARAFWRRVIADARISGTFRAIAGDADVALARAAAYFRS